MLTYRALPEDYPTILLSYIVYAVVFLIYARWLRHFFGSRVQRLGWLLLAGQLLLLTMHGWPIGPHDWWNHDAEYNIPVAFSTFQVMVGSFCALTVASSPSIRPRWQRGYWVLLSLGLYILGQDEFGVLHDRIPILEDYYLIGGVLLAASSVLVWWRLEARQRYYLYLLMAGLGISVVGAEVLDKTPKLCEEYVQIFALDCVRFHPLEETFEKLGAFFVVIALLGFANQEFESSRWQRRVKPMLLVFSLVTIIALAKVRGMQGLIDYRLEILKQPVSSSAGINFHTEFENGYRLVGVPLYNPIAIQSGMYFKFSIFGKVIQDLESRFGYAIHIVDQANDAVYIAHTNWSSRLAEKWIPGRLFKDKQYMFITKELPTERALWFVFSLWEQAEEGEYTTIPIRSSEDLRLSNTHIVLHEFVIPAEQGIALPENAPDFRFENGFALRGAELPTRAAPGDALTIPMTWQATSDGESDWVQFLHFVHGETGAFWNHDQPPLGTRLPTRLWYEGLMDTEVWQITLPEDLAPGRYAIYTGLYRLSDLGRLPVEDENGVSLPDARVPLGSLIIME